MGAVTIFRTLDFCAISLVELVRELYLRCGLAACLYYLPVCRCFVLVLSWQGLLFAALIESIVRQSDCIQRYPQIKKSS